MIYVVAGSIGVVVVLAAAGAAIYLVIDVLRSQIRLALRQNAALQAALLSRDGEHTAAAVMSMASSEEYVGDALDRTPQAEYKSEHPLGL